MHTKCTPVLHEQVKREVDEMRILEEKFQNNKKRNDARKKSNINKTLNRKRGFFADRLRRISNSE